MDKVCSNCKGTFVAVRSQKKYCSDACKIAGRPKRKVKRITKNCEHCGASVTGRSTIRFCKPDTECYAERRRIYMALHRNDGYIPNAYHRPRPEALKRFIRFGHKMNGLQNATPEQMIKLIENYY